MRASSIRKLVLAYRVGSVLAALWVFGAAGNWPLLSAEAERRAAVNTLAGIDATLLGFLVSAAALLYAVANTRLVQNLIRTGHYRHVVADLFVSAGAFMVALLFALAATFLRDVGSDGQPLFEVAMYASIGANAGALLLLIPPARGLWILLRNLEPEGGSALR